MWNDVKYEAGTIKVVAYDQSGKAIAEEVVHTAGKPDHLVLEADKKELIADGKDLSYVTVKVVDKDGNLCPDASNELSFKVSGAGKFKVTANGDASSLELFHLPHMKTFQGMLVATVQAGTAPGKITLNVSGKGLKTGVVQVDVK